MHIPPHRHHSLSCSFRFVPAGVFCLIFPQLCPTRGVFHDPRRAVVGLNHDCHGPLPYHLHRALLTNGSRLARLLLLHTNRPVPRPIQLHLTNVFALDCTLWVILQQPSVVG